MLYMFLLYHDPRLPQPPDIMERHFAVWRESKDRGAYRTSEAIGGADGATTVRLQDGKTTITDGPFAETKEVLGGFYILDCKDLDEALEYAAKIPDSANGAVEVRVVRDVPGWEYSIPGERAPF